MFSKANLGLVWWPVALQEYDEQGALVENKAMFLFRPFTAKQLAERQRLAIERIRTAVDSVAAPAAGGEQSADAAQTAQRIASSTVDQLLAGIDEKLKARDEDTAELAARVIDWRVKTADGDPVPFDREFLAELLQHGQYYVPISEAFEACSQGALRKNSSPGPAGAAAQVQA